MKLSKSSNSRRAFIKATALGLGALGAGASSLASATADISAPFGSASVSDSKGPASDIAVWFTNSKQRFAAGRSIQWRPASTTLLADSVRLVDANKFQDILGFGGCFSDAACYVFHQLREPAREQLL